MTLPHSLTREQLLVVVSAGAVLTLILTTAIDFGIREARRLRFLP